MMRSLSLPSVFAWLALASVAPGLTLQEGHFAAEILVADDIAVEAYKLDYSASRAGWQLELGLGANRYGMDYENSLFASSARLEESTTLANIAVSRDWGTSWQTTLGGRTYDGFSDYRSVWLAEYYRESWSAFPDYRRPDPQGHAVQLSATWHYTPGAGRMEVSTNFGRDRVTPAWAFDPSLGRPISSRESLNTVSGTVRVDQALNGWLKTALTATHQSTTDRENRLALGHVWAASAGPIAARVTIGYTREEPAFEGTFGGIAGEWAFLPAWTATVRYRVYQDSGEISASSFTASAPGLDTRETYLSLLWDRGDLAISLGVGFLASDYKPLSTENSFFGELYQDRDWVNVRAAASLSF